MGPQRGRLAPEQIYTIRQPQVRQNTPWVTIASAEQIEEFFTREPLSPADEFIFHDRDVRCRSSEGCAQPGKEQSKLIERNLPLFGLGF